MRTLLSSFLVLASLIACGEKNESAHGVIPQAQKDALEKARGVEDVLKEQELQMRKRVDEADGSDP